MFQSFPTPASAWELPPPFNQDAAARRGRGAAGVGNAVAETGASRGVAASPSWRSQDPYKDTVRYPSKAMKHMEKSRLPGVASSRF